MDRRALRIEEMIVSTRTWVDVTHTDFLLLAELPGSLPLLTELSQVLKSLTTALAMRARYRSSLDQECAELDAEHDQLARGLYSLLDAYCHLSSPDSEKAEWHGLRDTLFPEALSFVGSTYEEEARYAVRRVMRLSEEQIARLKAHRVDGASLWSWLEQWQHTAARLGEKDALRRQRWEQEVAAATLQTQGRWYELVDAVLARVEQGGDARLVRLVAPLRGRLDGPRAGAGGGYGWSQPALSPPLQRGMG